MKITMRLLKLKSSQYCYNIKSAQQKTPGFKSFLHDTTSMNSQDQTDLNADNVKALYLDYCSSVEITNWKRGKQMRAELDKSEAKQLLHQMVADHRSSLQRVPPHFFDPPNPSFINFKRKLDIANPRRQLDDQDYERSLNMEEEV
jgi:hypothetical protein